MSIEQVKQLLRKKPMPKKAYTAKDMLSSGATMLNLACTGRPHGCFIKGHYYFFVGDSESGKTFLALTCLAEATINKNFDDYDLIYDNAEDGALMDMGRFFGPQLVKRLNHKASLTVQDFYANLDKALKSRPCIYILDSMDSLQDEAMDEKFVKRNNAKAKGKEAGAGEYGLGKAKANSTNLPRVIHQLSQSGSILVIISQTRDNIGFGAQFNPKTRAGGRALKFYATLEIWTSPIEKIKKTVRGKARQLGMRALCHVKKNRVNGRDRKATVALFHSVGIDDVGSCVDFLVDEDHWQETKGKISASEFDMVASREKLVQFIEAEDREAEIRTLAHQVWSEIEEACVVERKSRYA